MQYYFGNIIEVHVGNGVWLPYSVRENAPLDAYSLIVRELNPDGTLTSQNEVVVLGLDPEKLPFIYLDWAEYQRGLTFTRSVRRMFSGL
jgi:hypothetical protein